ncbi:MAG TPA: ABC transporter permease [Acidimicrobiales bacterium]|nr:ABC transporter permease [Acidimicrobiales bacterium]
MTTIDGALPQRAPRRVALGWAFVERQTNLWKRYWAWEVVWLVYGVVNTLAITFIAKEVGASGVVPRAQVSNLLVFLLIGTLVWAYLSAVLDDVSLTITWERWEGTIEHTLMAPVPRTVHLLGMAAFAVLHATVRTLLILVFALPFFHITWGDANWGGAAMVLAAGSLALVGLGILTGILPLLYPERGEQMSFMVQAMILLVSGVYYGIDVLPGALRVASVLSPATYVLRGIRGALIDGRSIAALGPTLAVLVAFGVVLVPLSMVLFSAAERWAKRTGRLKRQG